MLDFINQSNTNIGITLIEKIYAKMTSRDVELIIVCDEEMRMLNKQHRNKDSSTDVLSFPLDDCGIKEMPLGSIVICLDEALRALRFYKHTLEDEMALLFIHGMLHLLGYDHESDNGEHREAEKSLITEFALPDSLIIRTESGYIK